MKLRYSIHNLIFLFLILLTSRETFAQTLQGSINTVSDQGTVTFNGASYQTLPDGKTFTGQNIFNLTLNNSAGFTSAGNNYLNIKGILNLANGTFTPLGSIYLYGPVSATSGNISSNHIVGFFGSTAQTIPTNLLTANTVNTLAIQNSAGVTLASNTTLIVSSELNLQSGYLNMGTGDTLRVEGAINYTSGGISTNDNAVVDFSDSGPQTIPAGSFKTNTVTNLNITHNAGIASQGALMIGNSLSLSNLNGTTSILATGQTVSVGGILNIRSFSGTPIAGQAYTIIAAGTVSGTFATLNMPTGITGSISYPRDSVVVTVTGVLPSLMTAINKPTTVTTDTVTAQNSLLHPNISSKDTSLAVTTTVYPNPSVNYVNISLKNAPADSQVTIRLISQTGRTIATQRMQSNPAYVDMSQCTMGIYYIQLVSQSKVLSITRVSVLK